MNQNVERTEALRKVRVLMEQTQDRGRTEGEMTFAFGQIQKLMTAFAITEDEVYLSDSPCIKVEVDTGAALDTPVVRVVTAIGEYCGVMAYRVKGATTYMRDAEGKPICTLVRKVNKWGGVSHRRVYKKTRGNVQVVFFGLEQDVKMAEFLFRMIQGTVDAETARFKRTDEYKTARGPKKSASHSFQYGMITRIAARLRTMKEEQAQEVQRSQLSGTDLVLVKQNRVEEEFRTTGTRLVTRRTNARINNFSAHGSGTMAGDRVNLSRPIENDGDSPLLLS